MLMQERIREIVATFELPKILEELIAFRATRNIEFLGLSTYVEQYRHISELVERTALPWFERYALRLDEKIAGDSRRTWHEVIANEEHPQDCESAVSLITLEQAFSIASIFMDEREKRVVQVLLKRGKLDRKVTLALSPNDIVVDFLGIKYRTEALARKLENDVRLHQPERNIVYFRLDNNPYVQWSSRRYYNNPLAFFERHGRVYDLFRKEGRRALKLFDHGLYESLRKYGQLDDAIPDIHKSGPKPQYTADDEDCVVKLYYTSKRNSREASRLTGLHPLTVRKIWRKHKLRANGKSGPKILREVA